MTIKHTLIFTLLIAILGALFIMVSAVVSVNAQAMYLCKSEYSELTEHEQMDKCKGIPTLTLIDVLGELL